MTNKSLLFLFIMLSSCVIFLLAAWLRKKKQPQLPFPLFLYAWFVCLSSSLFVAAYLRPFVYELLILKLGLNITTTFFLGLSFLIACAILTFPLLIATTALYHWIMRILDIFFHDFID